MRHFFVTRKRGEKRTGAIAEKARPSYAQGMRQIILYLKDEFYPPVKKPLSHT
jgi:hypothetical protein